MMKTNTERLVAALKQVDDGEFVALSTALDEICIEGRWEAEPLDGAIDTHLAPLSSVIKQRDGQAMYLREQWAEGTTGDGRPFTISASGVTLILDVGEFGPEREVYTIHLTDLAPAWLRTVGAQV